jgi:low affinity Fe/Cu permease
MVRSLQQVLTVVGISLSRPWAILAVFIYTVAWLIFDRRSLDWHSVATLATLLIALFIQRSEHRDTQAIHAKLDELLRAHGEAQDRITRLDEREPEQVEAFRNKAQDRSAS